MWQKLMRTWLIGAAVTMAVPEGPLQAETPITADTIGGPGENTIDVASPVTEIRKAPLSLVGEPKLAELLNDPVCLALMRRDGITPDQLKGLTALFPRPSGTPMVDG